VPAWGVVAPKPATYALGGPGRVRAYQEERVDESYTVAGMLRTQAGARPDQPMLTHGTRTVTWAEEHRRAGAVAHALLAEGLDPGDRVAFLDRNGLPYFDTLFGAALVGVVHVAVNWRLAPAEMAAVIDDSEASILVVASEFLPCLRAIEGGLPRVRRIIVLDDGPGEGSGREGLAGPERLIAVGEWLADRPDHDPSWRGGASHVSLQLYTSGTTGLPKGVMLTNGNLATAIGDADSTFSIDATTVSLVAMPLFHIGGSGWALCSLSRGGRAVVLRDVDPLVLLQLVEEHRITEMFVVPAVLMLLLATPGIGTRDLSSLRTIFYGASPIAEDVLVRCLEVFRCQFTQVYGMTETTGAITSLAPQDHDPDGPRRHLLRSAGTPLNHVELQITDPDTTDAVGPGAIGEVWTRSPYNMLGYWRKPEETAHTVDADGWLHTGDAGYLDDDGYLYLHDRIKDMIVSGGENIYPAEVENVLLAHPGVADAAVIGVPHESWGETVKAVVVAAPGAGLDVDEIIAFCRGRLAHYKCPTSVDVVDSLPRNPSGKLLKRELREPHWSGQGRRIR
jgi:long-chain acyl-CoA synthetase